jgi:phospholipid/cholesterol/gamma-HCH transport system substrate-binding protein
MRSKHERRSRVSRVAALACAGALALSGCDFDVYSLPLPGGADLGSDPYSVEVEFRDVLDLVPQSSVKVNDVTVGKVTDIEVDGYRAKATLALNGDVELPDNTLAEIRMTSLLGEKFVSLKPPANAPSSDRLSDGDVIPLDRSGRNPEVEEVLGAMSLLLNGGGVAQLKTISAELNKAFEGRESEVKSVLNQLDTFMAQLDENKEDIVEAIESLNRLAISINEQRGSIELALDEMPAALESIDRQRDDLVKMLRALNDLSSVATRVIKQSKTATIDSLRALDPTLTQLAEAGDSLPKSFQVFLTYPFVDEVVGRNPAQARNLHMGDYTNLSVQMDIDLTKGIPEVPGPPTPDSPLDDAVDTVNDVTRCLNSRDPESDACEGLTRKQLERLVKRCAESPLNPVCRELAPGSGGGGDGGGDDSSNPLPLPLPGLGRAVPGQVFFGAPSIAPDASSADDLGYDPTLGALLIQGMVQR